jgi:hypothetical protein
MTPFSERLMGRLLTFDNRRRGPGKDAGISGQRETPRPAPLVARRRLLVEMNPEAADRPVWSGGGAASAKHASSITIYRQRAGWPH